MGLGVLDVAHDEHVPGRKTASDVGLCICLHSVQVPHSYLTILVGPFKPEGPTRD